MTKKLISLIGSILLVAGFATPAESAGVKYSVYQKTLATFSSTATTLTAQQKAQVKSAVDANPTAEKFICTGIRYYSQPMSVNIMVRKRAKAACEYAKQLNPELSTWYQNKPTQARSYAGKVLLTVKSPIEDKEMTTSRKPYPYPNCDTLALQPMTKKFRQDRFTLTYETNCATDRTATTEALEALVSGTNLEPCRLNDRSLEGQSPDGMRVGSPRSPTKWADGERKVILVAFDFPDIKDPIEPQDLLGKHVEMFKEYMDTFSRGKVSFDFYIHPTRITLLEPSYKFSQSEAQQNTSQWGEANVSAVDYFYTQAIRAMDPVIDFSGHDMVLFIPPRGQEVFAEFNLWPPHSKTYPTDEGPIVRGFTPGGGYHFRPDNDLWFFWAHEVMHYYRLPDLYWHDQNSVKGTENTFSGAFKEYDIMDGKFTRTLNSYLMWLAGWSLDGEHECLTPENFTNSSYEIFPVGNKDDSLKSVMIKLSDTQLLVAESRRNTKFDRVGKRANEGVLVYIVDTTRGNGEGALTVLAPEKRTFIFDLLPGGNGTEFLDAFLYEGNKLEVAGYKIEVNKAFIGSDVVSISRVPGWQPGMAGNYLCVTKENRQLDDPDRVDCPLQF